jgi:putative membrane protein
MGLIIGLFFNILALYLATSLVSGFTIIGGWKGLLVAGVLIGLLNMIVRPIIKLVSFPLILLTFGLFSLVINALILWLASQFTNYIIIENIIALVWATVIMVAVNILAKWAKC